MFKYIQKPFLIIMFIIFYLPILFLMVYSFNSGDTMVNFEGFSLMWYKSLFSNIDMLIIILNTLIVAILSATIATIIGTVGAIFIYQEKNKKVKTVINSLNSILLVSPDVIIGISMLLLFTVFNIKFGFVSVTFAHIAFSIPIVVVMVLPKLYNLNINIINAARDLGASDMQVLSKVIIPQIMPGIIVGFFTAFTYSLDDFAVTFFVTGNGFNTLAISIYSQARLGISLEVNALSSIIFIITLLFAIAYYLIDTKKESR